MTKFINVHRVSDNKEILVNTNNIEMITTSEEGTIIVVDYNEFPILIKEEYLNICNTLNVVGGY